MSNQTDYELVLEKVTSGFEGNSFWAQARSGTIPGDPPTIVLTTQKALRSGSDVFFALNEFRTDDMGKTWQGPVEHTDTLGRRKQPNDTQLGVCDMEPQWHHATGKLLLTGHTVGYADDKHPIVARKRGIAYSVYDDQSRTFTPWDTVKLPEKEEPIFQATGSGSAQIHEEEDGTLLIPVYGRPVTDNSRACYNAGVVRCAFDGTTLTYIEHGNLQTLEEPRGFCEPSIIKFADRYFMTLRNDVSGYVTSSQDGLNYEKPNQWCFDDGENLGNYNTQQHWVSHGGKLYLTYTRRGLNNDHVFRHRAPIVMSQVDPDRLCVLRDTEREIVPNRGARIGNFSVNKVNEAETWLVVSEWMQPVGCEQYGSDNTIWVARLKW